MKKLLAKWFDDNYAKTAFGLFLIGLFLRLYRLNDFVTFLGDQGRDAIIIKRMLTFEHFPAIGAPTSVGQVYLGPFYYYFIAPWLLFFRFEPIGLAIGVAIFSSLYLLINYFIVKDLLNKKTALVSTALITFSSILIEYSRFSWNPNLLPLFSLLTVYFFIISLQKKRTVFFALTGAFLSFAIQLHYLSLFLIPPLCIGAIVYGFENKKKVKKIVTGTFIAIASFMLFSLPLVVFDVRHQFLNLKNFITLFSTSSVVASNKIRMLFSTFWYLNNYLFSARLNGLISSALLILLFLACIILLRKKENIRSIMLFFMLLLFGISLYNGPKVPHYFGMIYPIYAVVIAYFISRLPHWILRKGFLIIVMAVFIVLQSKEYYFLWGRGSNQIAHAKRISTIILHNITNQKYTVTGLPQQYSDSIYRYFLEIWGRRSIEKDSIERAEELFVICDGSCWPIGNPQWDIAFFAPNKVAGKWSIDNVTIYKLTR